MIHRYTFVTARDGIRLATDVYLPGGGLYPALIQRTPYGKYDDRAVNYAEWMAERGYAAVVQDVRGRHDSEGDWHPYDNREDTDGFDTIEWIVRQPWSDSTVAFVGSSYLGFTGYMAAMTGHPAIKGLIARVPATGLFHHHFYMGGIFSLARICWGTLANRRVQQYTIKDNVPRFTFEKLLAESPDILSHLPVVEIGDLFPMPIPWWRTWLQHATEDDHWKRLEAIRHFDRINIPIYHIGGWHDDFCSVPIENFTAAGNANPQSEQRLLMGMWPHHLNLRSDHGGIDYGPEALIDLFEREKRFLDRHLLKQQNTLEGEPPVRLFIMGPNCWRNFDAYPPPDAGAMRLYLRSGGRLSVDPPGEETPDRYVYDPLQPTPFPWDYGEPELPVLPGWEPDPRPGEDRLLFTLPPLERPLYLVGPVVLKLYARTDAKDTDWFSWIGWEDPESKEVRMLTYGGRLRGRFRNGFETPSLLEPGECCLYTLPLGHTARILPPGTKLILCIQSSAYPWYSRNLNTGENNYTNTRTVPARQTVHHDALRPTHIVLSVVSESFNRIGEKDA